ncbi:putative Alpha-galactosidase 3 [Paratrimastix pyriformis]|uniref:Alpha-galactosidase n=1 Tax=Paratrimastix pyriformis TaxID=342808 RepID=A0ABQ8UT85_9EUKA|nr:putative Alpha-galactosidase 3 [Paratrimastix pyriformis]|eukprot:GAFH01002117.1.p1 GENE.GAFH01002117.1~~GAFH01002117.1.p1  ORF type:complete len:404 (+),score=104.22 GAFH01002117.1:19-1230(+)
MTLLRLVVLFGVAVVMALDNGLARTPPMGWSSWNTFRCDINEALILETAEKMISEGMRDAGYVYVNIDDCWSLHQRNASGYLVEDPAKFPHGIRYLADYLHKRGMKLGLYNAAGAWTCQGYPGSYHYEKQDAELFASYDVDFWKQDWCAVELGQDPRVSYPVLRDAVNATGHPMVLSICEYGLKEVWTWGPTTGNMWRTTNDISDSWDRWTYILEAQAAITGFSGPGGWNDMDMLVVGMGGQPDGHYQAHFSLWALLNSPLIAGNDVRKMTAATREILLNGEVIAVNQDPLGIQGTRIWQSFLKEQEVWARPLTGGMYAAVLLNRDEAKPRDVTLKLADLPPVPGTPAGQVTAAMVRDLWAHADLGTFQGQYTAKVPARSAVMITLRPACTRMCVRAPCECDS